MTPTEDYIQVLSHLKCGALGLLRAHAGQELDQTLDAFDLFAGLWWPLRQRNRNAPRRQVAWLIAKLYAHRPLTHSCGRTLASQLRRCQPQRPDQATAFQKRFDAMLVLPVAQMESPLHWVLAQLHASNLPLDWVALTNDLSFWDDSIRIRWAEDFLNTQGGR